MSHKSPKNGQHSSDKDTISSVTARSSRIPQLAVKRISAPQGIRGITPTRSAVTESIPSSQSKIATSVAPRPLRGILKAYEPITPHSKLSHLAQEKISQTTKISPGGSIYQLHPASISLGIGHAKWIRIAEPPRMFLNSPSLPNDFQSAIMAKLAEEHNTRLKEKFRAHARITKPQTLYSLDGGQGSSSETIKPIKPIRVAAIDPRGRLPVTSLPKVTKASRRDAIHLAQVQALIKDSFQWLEETLEAEGISTDDDPQSPESPLTVLTPTLYPPPLLPSPIIFEAQDVFHADGGSGGLGLDLGGTQIIDPFASNSPSHPAESVYFSPYQSPDVIPKATSHKVPVASTQTVTDPSHNPYGGPFKKGFPAASTESREIYLQSLESAWDGDQLTRYPLFSGGSTRTGQLEKGKISTTSSFMAISTMKTSSNDPLSQSGSEPMLASERAIGHLRANSILEDHRDGSKGFLPKHRDHVESGFINSPAERSLSECPQENSIAPPLRSATSVDCPKGETAVLPHNGKIVHDSTHSSGRRPVSPEVQKKVRNFSRPTRPSIFLSEADFSLDASPLPNLVPSLPMTKPDNNLGFKSVPKAGITHLVYNIATNSRSISKALFQPSVGKHRHENDASNSTVPAKHMDAGQPPLLLKAPVSGLSRFKLNLPIGASKSNKAATPCVSPPDRKSFDLVAPKTTKRLIYSRPTFSKSLPHVSTTNQRPAPMPSTPKNTISAGSRACSTPVYGPTTET